MINNSPSPLDILQDWKKKPYQKTNYENIHIYYGDQKYVRMKPKSHITLTPGFLHLILKHPKEWVRQNLKIQDEVTLHNETHNVLYYTIIESLLSDEEKELKLHVKNGIPTDDEQWLNEENYKIENHNMNVNETTNTN